MNLLKKRAHLIKAFRQHFGPCSPPPRAALAPGRVNLIGEHTDYNGGLVLPMAINRHTAAVFAPNGSDTISVYAQGINEADTFSVHNIQREKEPHRTWTRYVRGTAWALAEKGVKLKGCNVYLESDLPIGAGLSSSAAVEIATGLALLTAAGEKKMDRQTLALCGQRAEHEFAGVRCGIMDQTVVACAKAGHALLLDCRSLALTHVPINVKGYSFAVFDTGVRHALASSGYNQRRAECERAAAQFKRVTLREATLDDLIANIGALSAPEEKRVRHVLTENLRVTQFASALQRGDVGEMGALLHASHMSLKDDYEVSCTELDKIVSALMPLIGGGRHCPGARMTGGGFGGSVVALLKSKSLRECEERLGKLAPGGGLLLSPGEGAIVVELT